MEREREGIERPNSTEGPAQGVAVAAVAPPPLPGAFIVQISGGYILQSPTSKLNKQTRNPLSGHSSLKWIRVRFHDTKLKLKSLFSRTDRVSLFQLSQAPNRTTEQLEISIVFSTKK